MAEQNTAPVTYGYADDSVKVSPFVFGLNAGVTNLIKYEWIHNGGKDGAEQEALDVVFKINGADKSYRMFPVVKAFDKNNAETTDPNHEAFKEAVTDFNARITHILHAFISSEDIKTGLSRPISSFKDFAQITMGLLPKNYKELPLDIFLQYQWAIDEGQDRTFLDIPKKMKYGAWLKPARPGKWVEKRIENPADSVREALWYENEKGEKHDFTKTGWFMNSNFAKQLRRDAAGGVSSPSSNGAAQATQSQGTAQKSSW